MPKDENPYTYVVVGSGIVPTRKIVIALHIFGKIIYPIPVFQYFIHKEDALKAADNFAKYHEEVVVAKIIKRVEGTK